MRDLAAAVAGGTGFIPGPGGAPAAGTVRAGVEHVERHFFFTAPGRFLKINFEIVAEIVAAAGLLALAGAIPEKAVKNPAAATAAKHSFKNIPGIVEATPLLAGRTAARPRATTGRERRMAEPVIRGALLLVTQDFVGFAEFLEFFLSSRIAGILIRMIFNGEFPIRLFQVLGRGAALDAEHFVTIAFAHAAGGAPLLTTTRAGRSNRSPSL